MSTQSLKRDVFASGLKHASNKKRSFFRPSLSAFASYGGIFLLVMSLVIVSYQSPKSSGGGTVSTVASIAETASAESVSSGVDTTSLSVDELVATNVAVSIAERSDMPIATNVANLSQSLSAESELAQTDEEVISKPQIIQPTADSRSIQTYTTVAGDTVQVIAAKYGISAQTLKWANNLTSDALEPGRQLTIPPVDGVLYTVKEGDSIDSIASKYNADKSQIITYNDLELGGVTAGQQLIVPDGALPEQEQPGYVAPRTTTSTTTTYSGGYGIDSSIAGASVGNRYAFGNCTWYAYERRIQLGRPVGSFWGNASTWAAYAAAAGYGVGSEPRPGAVMQNGGGYGHVAIVESIDEANGVIIISEMNGYRFGGGFNRIGRGPIPLSEARSGLYRYIY